MISISEYQQLVQEVADLERKEAEAEGALAQMRERLKEEFKLGNTDGGLKVAIAAHKKLLAEIETLDKELAKAYAAYRAAHTELLKGN